MTTLETFNELEIRVGTVIEAKPNKKARNPSYKLKIDFGGELGIKKSSAQITALYTEADLIGRQVICCVNLPSLHVGDISSEVRVLGTDSEKGVVLLRPDEGAADGDRIF